MTVHAPKTEHHIGKETRIVPIFAELRPYLEDVFDPAADYVLPSLQHEAAKRGDWRAVNLRTRFEKIVKRAGVTQWPRLWHNLRASRQTELEERFPSHVVCAWLGNSEKIAREHYLQVRETDFQKATQHAQECVGITSHGVTRIAKTPGKPRVLALKVGDEGLEPVIPENDVTVQNRIELQQTGQVADGSRAAQSGAVRVVSPRFEAPDPRLLRVIEYWPMLSEQVRSAIDETLESALIPT